MTQIIHFKCPGCETELESPPEEAASLACPGCGRSGDLRLSASIRSGRRVDACAVCGHQDFYVQKDFNRTLGLAIVVAGVALSVFFFGRGQPLSALLALVAMAAVDGLIYALMPEVSVCYSCHAIYRGFERNPDHAPFDLELLERYGGRDPRR
jgi:predicted RNA-binding Zn-ribbon protein involved in translation (DUF1610 family)